MQCNNARSGMCNAQRCAVPVGPPDFRRPSQAASLPTPPPVPMGLHALWTSALPVANVLGFILTVVVNGLSGANDK
jgi:hypothetical protein